MIVCIIQNEIFSHWQLVVLIALFRNTLPLTLSAGAFYVKAEHPERRDVLPLSLGRVRHQRVPGDIYLQLAARFLQRPLTDLVFPGREFYPVTPDDVTVRHVPAEKRLGPIHSQRKR